MTLHQLKLFVAVAETLNLSITSARFHISQPAVTRQLRALADEFGARLYITTGRGVELTPEGERFLERAQNVLEAVAHLEGDFPPSPASPDGQLSIGACFPASASVIPAVMNDFVRSFPEVKVNLAIDATVVLLKSIFGGKLDLAVVLSLPEERESGRYEIVSYYTPVLVGPPDHPLTRKSTVTVCDLRDIPLILHKNRPISDKLLSVLRAAGVTPRIEIECANAEAVKTAVKAGLGFGLVFEEHVLPELRTQLLRPVNLRFLKAISVPCYAVYPIDKSLGHALQSFVNLLYAHGKETAGHAEPTASSGGH